MPSKSLVTPLKRTAIFVRNIETSASFYEDLFGYELWVEGQMLGEENDTAVFELVGLVPGKCRYKVVRANRTDYGMIGFFEYDDPTMKTVERVRGRVGFGETCLVFVTPDLDVIRDRLTTLGAEMVCEPLWLTSKGEPYQREMTFYDRDGVMVNVIEQPVDIPLE